MEVKLSVVQMPVLPALPLAQITYVLMCTLLAFPLVRELHCMLIAYCTVFLFLCLFILKSLSLLPLLWFAPETCFPKAAL